MTDRYKRHHFLCSNGQSWDLSAPWDTTCWCWERFVKEPHREAIEDEKRRDERKQLFDTKETQ